jgi:amidohydrolase
MVESDLNQHETPEQRSVRLGVGGRAFAHIAQFHPELTAFRRDLHAHPELGFEEVYTARRVAEGLAVCGVDEVHTGIGKTGVVAVVHGRANTASRMIGLRADMDALPMPEHNEFGWKSTNLGRMHACGHDGHTAMLMGAARYLAQTRNFDGIAVLIFQPGEEGYAGARAMIEDGLFDRFPVQSVFGMHNWPAIRPGQIGVSSGPVMANADKITIEISGIGGHGAHPYNTVDPVVVAGHLITAVQSIVSRNVRAVDTAVVSLCGMQAGDMGAFSVIPGSAKLIGTVRTFKADVKIRVQSRLQELCRGIAQAFGAQINLHYEDGYPATINTKTEAEFAATVATGLVGGERVLRDMDPSMGAEDFAFMLQHKPGAYLRIGQGDLAADGSAGLGACFVHNSRYDFNDAILPLGAALHASLAEQGMPLAA